MESPRRQVESLFQQIVDKGPAERSAFLDGVRVEGAVRMRVESLLKAHDNAGDFLNEPAIRRAPQEGPTIPDASRHTTASSGILAGFLDPCDTPSRLGRLAHYEILDVLGRGGMGIVLRAMDITLNRVVAIKVLAPHLAADPAARTRVLREARAAAAVSHPHIIAVYGVDEAKCLPYLVMECVSGPSLQQRIDKGALSLVQILRIGVQIASGLAAAHAQGLVHRDIKPDNILLENGVERAKLTDFGLARAVDDVWLTREGTVHGTPLYMSPEQGRGTRVDQRSDLFSLGGVIYAMCTGRPPFRGETSLAVLRRVCDEAPQPIRDLNPEMPEALERIVSRLLAKDPEDRFPSAASVADLLSRFLAHVQQDPPTPFQDQELSPTRPGTEDHGSPGRPTVRRPARPRLGGRRASGVAVLLATIAAATAVMMPRPVGRTGPATPGGAWAGPGGSAGGAIPPVTSGLWVGHPPGLTDRPVRVFILAGDSNMSGRPESRLLKANPARTRELFGHLLRDGKWLVRDDVWIKYLDRSGPLTVGYGQTPERFGPELEFGQVVGDHFAEQVLIIKTCWGGHRLNVEFRSPRMGPAPDYLLEEVRQELLRQDPDATTADAQARCGILYRDMLAEVRRTLEDLGQHVPAYRGQGYVLAGFVWFSGWNDLVQAKHSFGYSAQLADLIRDVRADLESPNLPVIIGQMGVNNTDVLDAYQLDFRAQQAAVADLPEFADNVAMVATDPFWDREAYAVFKKGWREYLDEWNRVGSDFPYHYLGSAKTIVLIGRAFGRAMVGLQRPAARH